MARRGSYTSVVQFGPAYVSLLRVKSAGPGLEVVASEARFGRWSVEDGSLGRAVGELAAQHGIAEDRIVSVLPRHHATLRVLDLPSRSDAEIEGMVHLTAEEIVPFPIEQLVTGHCILEETADGASSVLAAVVQREAIDAHLRVLDSAGLVPEQIYLSTACLLSAAAALESKPGCEAFVDVSLDGIEVAVLREGHFVFGRGIAVDPAWSGEALSDKDVRTLAAEVRQSLLAYRRESSDGRGADAVRLCSACVDVASIADAVGDALELPCRPAADFLDVVQRGGDRLDAAPVAGLGAALIAQDRGAFKLGLLPKRELQRQASASIRSRALRIAAMLLATVLAMAGVYGQAVYQQQQYIALLEERAEALRPNVRTVRMKRDQLRQIQEQVERRDTVLELLGALAKLAPKEGLNVTRFTYDREEGITLRGRALEAASFDGMIDDIRGVGAQSFAQFAQARELYRTLRKERGKDVWDFAIRVPFSGESE